MAIKLRSTKDYATHGIKVLVYGRAGIGKTTLCATAPNPLIISAEGGLLSITDRDIPYIEISSIDDLSEAYDYITTGDGRNFSTICLDSVSEIAERVLAVEKASSKDGRKAYGDMQDKMYDILRSFRDIPDKNIVFVAKQEKVQTDTGALLFGPSMPGQKLSQQISYFFDEVFTIGVGQDDQGPFRYIQTQPDMQYEAKDRSGKLDSIEPADLTAIFSKIQGAS